MFKSSRQFAAFLGLVPRQNSFGGKACLGRMSKMGDVVLAEATGRWSHFGHSWTETNTSATGVRVRSLMARIPARVATVATANHTVRIAWAVLAHSDVYRD